MHDSSKLFPMPFGGIEYVVKFNTVEALQDVVDQLMKCHPHNFAVQVDGLELHISRNAAECMRRIYGGDSNRR